MKVAIKEPQNRGRDNSILLWETLSNNFCPKLLATSLRICRNMFVPRYFPSDVQISSRLKDPWPLTSEWSDT